jgi:hypothetical protein
MDASTFFFFSLNHYLFSFEVQERIDSFNQSVGFLEEIAASHLSSSSDDNDVSLRASVRHALETDEQAKSEKQRVLRRLMLDHLQNQQKQQIRAGASLASVISATDTGLADDAFVRDPTHEDIAAFELALKKRDMLAAMFGGEACRNYSASSSAS